MAKSSPLHDWIRDYWHREILPTMMQYIAIPNKSPLFEPDWASNGHTERSLQLAKKWVEEQNLPGLKIHLGRSAGRTPLLLLEFPGNATGNVLMYGHLDKQPEMTGWREDLGPWKPVLEGDRLYGRGGADDGYAMFSAVAGIKACLQAKLAVPRVVILIEFSEESGSPDLPPYLDEFAPIIGQPDLVIALDSGAGNYEQLWITTSLRGLVGGLLHVDVLHEGVHSGWASGIVPSSFRIARALIERLEDAASGQITPQAFHVSIPAQRIEQAKEAAKVLGQHVFTDFPIVKGLLPMHSDPAEMILNETWRPMLSMIGQEGIPLAKDGGNVLRPFTTLKLSLRIPPTLDAVKAQQVMGEVLSQNPPYKAHVRWDVHEAVHGWNAPEFPTKITQMVAQSSHLYFNNPPMYLGVGGTIPFMAMLGKRYPKTPILITGVLGPQSNAHGPNEFLHLPFTIRLTSCIAHWLHNACQN